MAWCALPYVCPQGTLLGPGVHKHSEWSAQAVLFPPSSPVGCVAYGTTAMALLVKGLSLYYSTASRGG